MEHVEQFQIILSYVKPQMMTSGSIRLRKLGCENLNGIIQNSSTFSPHISALLQTCLYLKASENCSQIALWKIEYI